MIIMFVYAGIPVLQLRLLARVAVHRDLEGPEIVFYEEFPVSFCGCKEGHIAGVHPSIGILGLIGYGIGHYAVALYAVDMVCVYYVGAVHLPEIAG